MKMSVRTVIVALLLAAAAGPSAADPASGSGYTAVLHQRINYWQLVPESGPALQVTAPRSACRRGSELPRGEWSVARTSDGGTELRPTFGPAAGPVLLVPCGDAPADAGSLQVPPMLIDWIAAGADRVVIE